MVYLEMPNALKSNRDYRNELPPEDRLELDDKFSENIMFAAQALGRGFRIRGIEAFTAELSDPARILCAAIEVPTSLFLIC